MSVVKHVVCKALPRGWKSHCIAIFDVEKDRVVFPYSVTELARFILERAAYCQPDAKDITCDLSKLDDETIFRHRLESAESDMLFYDTLEEIKKVKETPKLNYGGAPCGGHSPFNDEVMGELTLSGPCH